MSGVTGAVAELLGRHYFVLSRLRREDSRQVIRCGCGWEGQGFDEHVAADLFASGLLVSTAEVREQVEALASEWERRGTRAGAGCEWSYPATLRALLARLAPGGTGTTEAEVQR